MKITDIIWLAPFVEKLERKHTVSVEEVEQVLAKRPRIQFIERSDVVGEDLYRALGRTDAGRYLVVFFVYKRAGKALVISARDMTAGERKSYAKRKK
jgi:hypothetical protein